MFGQYLDYLAVAVRRHRDHTGQICRDQVEQLPAAERSLRTHFGIAQVRSAIWIDGRLAAYDIGRLSPAHSASSRSSVLAMVSIQILPSSIAARFSCGTPEQS